MLNKWLALTIIVLLLVSVGRARLGESTPVNPTPTLAPSKTPALVLTSTSQSPTTEPTSGQEDNTLLEPFTQDDLSILTGNIQRPNGLLWYEGKVYTSCSGDWTLYEIDPDTGTTRQYIYGVKNAHALFATSDENGISLWVPDFQSNAVVQITRGTPRNIASNLQGPWGIADLDGERFLVTNLLGNEILTISRSGETRQAVKNLRSPAGIAVDRQYIYVANTGSARRAIEWFAAEDLDQSNDPLDAQDSSQMNSLITGLQNVTNLTLAADGYLYFAYALGTRGVVGRIDPKICRENGGCTNDQVEIVIYSELAAPLAGLSISPDMRLFLHSIFSPDIYWVQLGEQSDS
jgi:hypothetical protein